MRSPTVKDDWVVEHRLSRLVSALFSWSIRSGPVITSNYSGFGPKQFSGLGHPRPVTEDPQHQLQVAFVCQECAGPARSPGNTGRMEY